MTLKCTLSRILENDVSALIDLRLYHIIFVTEEILTSDVLAIFKCCPNLSLVGLGTQTLKGSKTSLATVLLMYKIHVTIIINFSVTKKLEYKHRLNKSN